MTITDLYHLLFGKGNITDGNVIDMAEHGRAGGISTAQGFKFIKDIDHATKVTVSGSDTYVAIALAGTAQATAKWQCTKIAGTTDTVITYADGNTDFDNVATDLTLLTYS